jgi:hypothetical protein
MLQRRLDDEEESSEGGGGADTFEPIEQQVDEPAPFEQQAGGGGDNFVIGDNVDGGGTISDDFVIGDNVDGGQKEGPQQAEFQGRENRSQDVADAGGGAQVSGGGLGITGQELRNLAQVRLRNSDQATVALVDGLCDAVGAAWSSWQSTVTITGVSINAVTAIGGQLTGPPLQQLVAGNGAGLDRDAVAAVARAVGVGQANFTRTFSIPGLPLFPAFAAFPGPVAPPTPSLPAPMAATTMSPASFVGLADSVRLKDARKQRAVAAVLEALALAFQLWLTRTFFTILGTGPVPTFAPPYVPVGPVVGGDNLAVPGTIN